MADVRGTGRHSYVHPRAQKSLWDTLRTPRTALVALLALALLAVIVAVRGPADDGGQVTVATDQSDGTDSPYLDIDDLEGSESPEISEEPAPPSTSSEPSSYPLLPSVAVAPGSAPSTPAPSATTPRPKPTPVATTPRATAKPSKTPPVVAPPAAPPAKPPAYVLRINAGGPEVQEAGVTWRADQFFTGGKASAPPRPFTSSTPVIDSNQRWGMSAYELPVPRSGTYTLRLHLVENHYTSAGSRNFDVLTEGRMAESQIDIFAKTGARGARYLMEVPVRVTDGHLTITFTNRVGYATMAAIEVVEQV